MSKTGTEDARMFIETGADRFILGCAAPPPAYAPSIMTSPELRSAVRQALTETRRMVMDPTLLQDECAHTDLNAAGDRCLTCGTWAHQFVHVLVPATSLTK